jgi:hypothetical protein
MQGWESDLRNRQGEELLQNLTVALDPVVKLGANPEVTLNASLSAACTRSLAGPRRDIAGDQEDKVRRAFILWKTKDLIDLGLSLARMEMLHTLALKRPTVSPAPGHDVPALLAPGCAKVLGSLPPLALDEPKA